MKMEHINENTIRVNIEKSDLEKRGISFFDLLGSQQKVESFFYNILDEVGVRHEFEGSDAITFQVVPKRDGLDLYITKGIDNKLTDQLKETFGASGNTDNPLDQVIQLLESDMANEKQRQTRVGKDKRAKKTGSLHQVFVFEKLDHFIAFCHDVNSKLTTNYLYIYEGLYYWSYQSNDEAQMNEIKYKALEHGRVVSLSSAYLKEHGQVIMSDNAVDITKQHFKN